MRLLSVLSVLLLCGCGGGTEGPEMADVSGIITLGGKPLAGAEVHFTSSGFEGYGRTNDEGRYSLVRGAPIGECKVYITKSPVSASATSDEIDTSIEGMDEEQVRAMAEGSVEPGEKPLLPPEFSDPDDTKLSFDVPAGGTEEADFKL